MKINYKDYVIEIDNNKSTSKKELYKTIHDAILEIDNIIKRDNNSIKNNNLKFGEVIPWLKYQIKKANAPKMSVKSYFDTRSFEDNIETWIIKNHRLIIGYWDDTYGKIIEVAEIIINRDDTLQDMLDSIKDGSIDITKINNNSIKDSTSEYYKGYFINLHTSLHDEDSDCKYEIVKDGIIVDGANSIEEAKEKIDILVEKKSNYTKDASIIIDFDRYKPWSGAVATYDKIVNANKLDDLEAMIDELYPDGINETALNDWLWFDGDELLKELNIIDEDEMADGDLEEEIGMNRDLDGLSKEEQIKKVSKDYDVSEEQAKRVIEKMDKQGQRMKEAMFGKDEDDIWQ